MSDNLVISVDAMGGDNSPRVVIEGIDIAAKRNPDLRFLLFGDEGQIMPLLQQYPKVAKVSKVIHTSERVKNEDKPSQVIRNRNTSMYMAIDAVRSGRAQAIVSAGNTGALMAISKMVLKTIHGIHRPAICTIMPMGNIFAKHALGIHSPRVALLNIGAEEMKGKEEIHHALKILKNPQLDLNCTGYIEPHDISNGIADVIVVDGFTGNVALKTIEGTAKFVVKMIKRAIQKSIFAKIGLPFMMGVIYKIKRSMDPRNYNGAMLIGLNGLTVKSHGGTDAVGYSVAIDNAAKLVRQNFVATIRQEIEKVDLDELNQESIYEGYYL